MKRAVLITVILLLASIPASAQGTSGIQRHVIAAGGSTNGNLVGAIGQPVAGTVMASSVTLCSGFWCDDSIIARVGKANLIYSVTFGNIGITVVALALVVLIALRKLYDVTFNLWGTNGRSVALPFADSAPGDRGRVVLRGRPAWPVAGPNRHRRKPE